MGVCKKSSSLGKPVLVLRENTERPEAVDAGTVIMVGTNENKIVSNTTNYSLINSHNKMSKLHNPYGDGLASEELLILKNLN